MLNKAILPFGLFGISNIFGGPKAHSRSKRRGRKHSTRKGMIRKTARRAYMKKK